jgi:hypothetical protein
MIDNRRNRQSQSEPPCRANLSEKQRQTGTEKSAAIASFAIAP